MVTSKKTASKSVSTKAAVHKKTGVTETIVLQYGEKNVDITTVVDKIKEVAHPVTSLSIYFKPEDDKAYYVADGVEGSTEI